MRPIDADELMDRLKSRFFAHDLKCDFDRCARSVIISCMEAVQRSSTITLSPNAPLTLDELLEMDGEPVWVETPDKSDCCNGLSTVKLTAPWKPGGLKPHVLIVSKNGDRNYAELLMVGFGGKIYRCKPKEGTK